MRHKRNHQSKAITHHKHAVNSGCQNSPQRYSIPSVYKLFNIGLMYSLLRPEDTVSRNKALKSASISPFYSHYDYNCLMKLVFLHSIINNIDIYY